MKGAVELGVRWQSEAATPLFPVLAIHAAARRPAKHVSNEIGSQAEATSGAKSGVAGLRTPSGPSRGNVWREKRCRRASPSATALQVGTQKICEV